ncbi:MAG: toprim domain-containing protein [Spirochaetia bacterium]|nr:toprim domain-containing protein [Spirochaetia bacterium]
MAYDANSIQIKDFRSACRSTPGMYIGTDGQDAAFNCFLEVLNNAADEAMMGRGKEIVIELSDDCDTISCRDEGAGVPHGKNKDTEEVLIELFTSAHSSGKFDTSNYKKVRGCHGIGTSAVCVCSTSFEVWSRRDGAEYYLNFKDGIPQRKTALFLKNTSETGSTFKFTPDKKIFNIEGTSFNYERIKNELELTSYFIPRVKFILVHKGKKDIFYSENGLKDFAKNKIINPLHNSYIYGYKEFDDEVEVEVFAQWTDGKEKSYIFSNGALNIDGGTPESGAKTAFTRTINSLSKKNFGSDMIRKGLVYIVNIKHPHPIYQNQTKTKIQNSELRGYTQIVFTSAIKEFATKHKNEFDKIVEVLTKEQRAEVAAEKARKQVLETTKELSNEKKKRIILADKLKDCQNHGSNSGSVLTICEGDSALGALAQARPIDYIALLPIRGKIISALKHDQEKILQNEEVKAIFSALGCGFFNNYDSKKLRYQYVACASDSDVDGNSISNLITTLFFYMCPQFIKEGRLFRMRMPLFVLKYKDKTLYAFNGEERDNYIKKYGKPKEISRKKGIGENTPQETKDSVFGSQRRWERVQISDFEEYSDMMEKLMGPSVEDRKYFIMKNVDFSNICE